MTDKPDTDTLFELLQAAPKQEKPHYYHAMRIGLTGQEPRYFRKVTRSKTFPDVLVSIATIAFEANRLFAAGLVVEHKTHLIPAERMAKPFEESLLEDEKYVEGDLLDKGGSIRTPDPQFLD